MNNNTTIFDRLIENKLELAKLLIYQDKILVESKIKGLKAVWINVWKSKIIKETYFNSKEEAINATVNEFEKQI
jgi:hypothetical protein